MNKNKPKSKLLDPKIDVVFQILFSKSNPEIIKSLLSAILNMPIDNIVNNTLNLDLNKILERTYPKDKIGVLDVRAQINNKIEIDLEMQMVYKDMLLERILWYWAKLYSSQLKSGDDYSALKRTLEILIVNDSIPSLKHIVKPCTRWQIKEHEIFSEILTDKFEIVIIELPKVEKAYQQNKDDLLLQWMMFLLNPESLEVSKIMKENESIKIASEELEEISEEEINQRIAELIEKARRDDAALLSTGKRLGREEAEKEMQDYIHELEEKARRDDAALLSTGKRLGREEAEKEMQGYIDELKEKASKSAKLSLANGKRLGREEAEKEMQGYIDELKEKASKSAKLSLANGKRLGREEAEKEMQEKSRVAMQKITQNMLKLGINLEQISEITGLTKQEIESMNN